MKTAILYLLLIALCLDANAQGQEFQNWKVLKSPLDYCFIIPLDFEQKFSLLQQEIIEKNFEAPGVIPFGYSPEETLRIEQRRLENDSIWQASLKRRGLWKPDTVKAPDTTAAFMRWLAPGVGSLCTQDSVAEPYPKEWTAVAAEQAKRLKERTEKVDFSVYAFVNDKGEVLSVYFKINPALLEFIQEEELQVIYDTVVRQPFNPDNFKFTRLDNNLVGELLEKLSAPEYRNLSGEERWAMAKEVERQAKHCVYGVLDFFSQERNER